MTDAAADTAPKRTFGGHATPILRELKEAGLPLPPILEMALADGRGVCPPVAIGMREALHAWAADHGYSDEQRLALQKALMKIVRSPAYVSAMSSDEVYRLDINGEPTEPVSDLHRLSAAMEMLSRAARAGGAPKNAAAPPAARETAAAPAPRKEKEKVKAPAPDVRAAGAAVVVKTLRGKLSVEEIAKRAAALRNAAAK